LAEQALQLAEQDLNSKDAERVLHWVLRSPRSSPAAMQAAKHLAKHFGTSKLTIEWLFNQQPRAWTPLLYATFLQSELSTEDRASVEVSSALHDRALLSLSDEIKASQGDLREYELLLGEVLTADLRNLDGDKFASRLIETFKQLADQHGEKVLGGAKVRDLSDGATFAIRHLRLGKTATGLTGTTLDGKTIALDQYQGRVVLVDFWATWCAPCVGALSQLKQLQSKLQGEKFVIFGVNADENTDNIKTFTETHAIDWPTVLDADGTLQVRWMVASLPTYYVLDADHVVRYRGTDLARAANIVETLLGKDSVANMVQLTLQALDTNNDQRIDKGELPADKQNVMDAADLNKDGFLSVDELTAFVKANMTTTTVNPNAPQ
jgi:thiol-disulfide isomerase/thioredoxin